MPRRRDGGFTIIEVLLALAIVTIAMTALMRGTSNGIRSAGAAERQDMALALARSLLSRTGKEKPFEIGEQTGTSDGGVSWAVRTSEHRDPEKPAEVSPRAFWVRVEVAWKEPRSSATGRVDLVTMKLAEGR